MRYLCRCFLNGCGVRAGSRIHAKSTIYHHRKEDELYFNSLRKRGLDVSDELLQAIAWSGAKLEPEPLDSLHPHPSASPSNLDPHHDDDLGHNMLPQDTSQPNHSDLTPDFEDQGPAFDPEFGGGGDSPICQGALPLDDNHNSESDEETVFDMTPKTPHNSGSSSSEDNADHDKNEGNIEGSGDNEDDKGTSWNWLETGLAEYVRDEIGGDDDDCLANVQAERDLWNEEIDINLTDPDVLRALDPIETSYHPAADAPRGPPPRRTQLSDLSPEQMLSFRCYIRAEGSGMSVEQYNELLAEACHQKGVDLKDCMSLENTGRWFNAVSGLVPEYFDTCVHGHVAFVGPRANQMSCDAKAKKPGPINPRTNKSQQGPAVCDEARFETERDRRGGTVRKPRQQAVFLDPVPRIEAAFASAQQAKLLRSLYEDLMSFIKRRSESGNPDTGGYFDISSGQALARAHDLGAFHDERNCFFGISSDGALVQEQQTGSFWIWSVTLYNIPIESGRYSRDNTFILVIAPCATTPTDLDSFAWIILKRFEEAARGIWCFDSLTQVWFLWRGFILFFLADLMGQVKQSGFAMSRALVPCVNCEIIAGTKDNGAGRFPVEDGRATYEVKKRVNKKKRKTDNDDDDNGDANDDDDADDEGGDDVVRGQKKRGRTSSRAPKKVNTIRPVDGYYAHNGAPSPEPRTLQRYKAQISKAFDPKLDAETRAQYRTRFGITAIPLAARSRLFDVPSSFPTDIAHLLATNIPTLMWKSPKAWQSVPNGKTILAKMGTLIEDAKWTTPSAFGRYLRNPHTKANTNYTMHEWIQFVLNVSVPVLRDAGMPEPYVAHWADFVRLVRLVLDRSSSSAKRIELIDRLANRFVCGQERLFVKYDYESIEAMPVAVHRLRHLGEWICVVGNLSLVWQMVLERVIGYVKKPPMSNSAPVKTLVKKTVTRQQMTCWAMADPAVAGLRDELLPAPSQPKTGNVLTGFSPEETRASEDWASECEAWRRWGQDKASRVKAAIFGENVVRWEHYGRAAIAGGKGQYLSTTRREGANHRNRRQASRFLTTSFTSTGARASKMKSVYTVGRAMAIVRVPDDVDVSELGESRLVVVAELYPPVQRLHDAMPYVRIGSTTPAVLPFEAVEKLLGAYYSPREPRIYVFEEVFDNDGSTFVKLFEP